MTPGKRASSVHSLCLIICGSIFGCHGSNVANPLVANTGRALSPDGYQAALATADADGYPIIVKDEPGAFLRIATKSAGTLGPCAASMFDIKAWHGSVDVYLNLPPNCVLSESNLKALNHEGLNLAWGISQRARMLAGEPLGPAASPANYYDSTRNTRLSDVPLP